MPEENKEFGVVNALSDNIHESDTENYLIFSSCGILYGVNADNVVEIITEISVTHLPMVPMHISGVVNLRGTVVPVIDYRLMLGQMPGENYCMIVLEIDETQVGILVDSVEQMLAIEKRTILPVPSQQQNQMTVHTDRMCTLPNGKSTMMVLDCARLLHEA